MKQNKVVTKQCKNTHFSIQHIIELKEFKLKLDYSQVEMIFIHQSGKFLHHQYDYFRTSLYVPDQPIYEEIGWLANEEIGWLANRNRAVVDFI